MPVFLKAPVENAWWQYLLRKVVCRDSTHVLFTNTGFGTKVSLTMYSERVVFRCHPVLNFVIPFNVLCGRKVAVFVLTMLRGRLSLNWCPVNCQ